MRNIFRVGLAVPIVGALALAQLAPAMAQTAPSTQSQAASAFLADPASLLTRNQAGGMDLINQVKNLAMADAATVPVIINLLTTANIAQKRAMGQGLADAAKALVTTDQARAVDIQQRVAAVSDTILRVAFIAALGDTQLGGVGAGPGGGGAGGGVGGQTAGLPASGGNSAGIQSIGNNGTGTPNFTYTSSTTGASSSSTVSPF